MRHAIGFQSCTIQSCKDQNALMSTLPHSQLEAEDATLATEGAHGFWELSINKEHHGDMRLDRLAALLNRLSSPNIEVATTTAAALWGLATTGLSRRSLADLDIVTLLLSNIKRTLKMPTVPDDAGAGGLSGTSSGGAGMEDGEGGGGGGTEGGLRPPVGAVLESQRNRYQSYLVGALSVLLIDRNCRRAYLQQEPEFATLFTLARNLEGYAAAAAAARREAAAKLLTTLVQRDADARRSLIASGALRNVMALLNPKVGNRRAAKLLNREGQPQGGGRTEVSGVAGVAMGGGHTLFNEFFGCSKDQHG